MRICSLLPSATEMLFALGLGDSVVGVTFECNYPPEARSKPVIVSTRLPQGLTPAEIDREVSTLVAGGESLYRIDAEKLHSIKPELIVTQDLCHVCAASSDDLAAVLATFQTPPQVLSLNPHGLDDVWNDILLVGKATNRKREAQALVSNLRVRLSKVAGQGTGPSPSRVVCLEWLDPPFVAGHWVPEMVAMAGGCDVLGRAGQPSVRVTWQHVLGSAADFVFIMPCGCDENQTRAELKRFRFPEGWDALPAVKNGRVIPVSADSCFSRPGPRLAEGVELLAKFLSMDAARAEN
jgi:iron complex transport system substrate-binding protein